MRKPVDPSAKLRAAIEGAVSAADFERVHAMADKIAKSAATQTLREEKLIALRVSRDPECVEAKKAQGRIDDALGLDALRTRFAAAQDHAERVLIQGVVTRLQLTDLALMNVPGTKPRERADGRKRTLVRMRTKKPAKVDMAADSARIYQGAVRKLQTRKVIDAKGKIRTVKRYKGRAGREAFKAKLAGRKRDAARLRALGMSDAQIMAAMEIKDPRTLAGYFTK